jgi:hypothetical protein
MIKSKLEFVGNVLRLGLFGAGCIWYNDVLGRVMGSMGSMSGVTVFLLYSIGWLFFGFVYGWCVGVAARKLRHGFIPNTRFGDLELVYILFSALFFFPVIDLNEYLIGAFPQVFLKYIFSGFIGILYFLVSRWIFEGVMDVVLDKLVKNVENTPEPKPDNDPTDVMK